MEVNDTLLQKAATFVKEAAPQLEKHAAAQEKWAAECPKLVDSMIDAGALRADQRDAAIANLAEGGLDKCAALIPFLAGRIPAPAMGGASGGQEKKAGYGGKQTGRKASDAIWEEGMLGG